MTQSELLKKWEDKLQHIDVVIDTCHPNHLSRVNYLKGRKRAIYDCISDLRKLNVK